MPKDMQSLIDGYRAFRNQYFNADQNNPGHEPALYETLVRVGQQPKVLMIACSDSRVDPAIVTRCQPGDLFVVRNVANLVPPYEEDVKHYHGTSAALEFGVCGLNIRNIIVCGHSQCGGIRSLWEAPQNLPANSFVEKWMQIAKLSYEKTCQEHPETGIEHCAKESIVHSLKNLTTFPWIAERVRSQNLFLHGWYFDLRQGTLETFNREKEVFEVLE